MSTQNTSGAPTFKTRGASRSRMRIARRPVCSSDPWRRPRRGSNGAWPCATGFCRASRDTPQSSHDQDVSRQGPAGVLRGRQQRGDQRRARREAAAPVDQARSVLVGRQALSRVLNGRGAISSEMALCIEQWLGVDRGGRADVWLAQQTAYDLWQARQAGARATSVPATAPSASACKGDARRDRGDDETGPRNRMEFW